MGSEQQTKFNTSFIPKKNVMSPKVTPSRNSGAQLLSMIGLFIFLASVVAGSGVFAWQYQLEGTIEAQIVDLRKARDQFDAQTIKEANRLNEKIISASYLLEKHVAPTNIFKLLEEYTLKNIWFKGFQYATDVENDIIKISGEGEAIPGSDKTSGYETVILQSDRFGGDSNFRDVIFSNVQPTQNSRSVSFSFSATLDPSVILYNNKLGNDRLLELDDAEEDDLSSGNSVINNLFR